MPARRSATKKKTSAKPKKWVYLFVDGKAEGSAQMRALLGGKGAGIAEMMSHASRPRWQSDLGGGLAGLKLGPIASLTSLLS